MSISILAISGSLRERSHNRALLRHAAEIAPEDVEISFFEGLRDLPNYDEDIDGTDAPEPVKRLRAAILDADALLVATPEYNGSVPGLLKNAIDWASRPYKGSPLTNKTTAVIGATTGSYGAIWAQQDARKALGIAGARVIDDQVAVPKAHEAFHDDGRLRSDKHNEDLVGVIDALARTVERVAAASE